MELSSPRIDLKITLTEIEKMKDTISFYEFQESWENCLFRIESAWELTEITPKKHKEFEQWHKPYSHLRKKDPLLILLR